MIFKHHKKGIAKVTELLKKDESNLAVIIGGSLAHGTATEASDIDIMLVVSDDEFKRRSKNNDTWLGFELEYEEGKNIFIDGKYISKEYIEKITEMGNEPTRFAFTGAFATYSKIDNIDDLIQKVSAYPVDKKEENINKFYSQLWNWHWYCQEGIRKNSRYLINVATNKLVLFAGRLILAHNEILYPFHKWFMHSLECAENKPDNFMETVNKLLEDPTLENIDDLYNLVDGYKKWKTDDASVVSRFLKDSEQTWLDGFTYIDDI